MPQTPGLRLTIIVSDDHRAYYANNGVDIASVIPRVKFAAELECDRRELEWEIDVINDRAGGGFHFDGGSTAADESSAVDVVFAAWRGAFDAIFDADFEGDTNG